MKYTKTFNNFFFSCKMIISANCEVRTHAAEASRS